MLEQSVDRVTIRPATLDDAGAIAAIYNHFVRDTIVTCEEIEIDGDEIGRRMQSVWGASLPWLVAHFEQTGFKFGGWIDVAYYERVFAS